MGFPLDWTRIGAGVRADAGTPLVGRDAMPTNGRFAALLFLSIASLVVADPINRNRSDKPVAIAGSEDITFSLSPSTDVAPLTYRELPAGTVLNRVVVGGDDKSGVVSGVAEMVIYSNTLGREIIPWPGGFLVADDIATIAPDGCALTRFSFQVMGNENQSVDETRPYTVTYAMYDTCPEAFPRTSLADHLIQGTEGAVTLTDPAATTVEIDLSGLGVNSLTSMWLAITFDRDNCGTIGGAPALEGFSGDLISFPALGCSPNLGGFPNSPHASFNVEIYGEAETCPPRHIAYRNTREDGDSFNVGTDQVLVDDLTLLGGDCMLTSYEIALEGAGTYDIYLRRGCESDPPNSEWSPDGINTAIRGTYKRVVIGESNAESQIFRLPVEPPVLISGKVFLAVKPDNPDGGPILTAIRARIGSTGPEVRQMGELSECLQAILPSANSHGAMQATLICNGIAPTGACCDMFIKECVGGADEGEPCQLDSQCGDLGICDPLCREVAEVNCPSDPRIQYFQPSWREGDSCNPDPFDFSCGTGACCKPDDTCENLTERECEAVEPFDRPRQWQRGRYCGDSGQSCAFMGCLAREGDCTFADGNVGCNDQQCCENVCDGDWWCCHVEWDEICVRSQAMLCSVTIASATNADDDSVADASSPDEGIRAHEFLESTDEPLVLESDGDFDQRETPFDAPGVVPAIRLSGATAQQLVVERNGFVSVQVNVDAFGNNILGDAANEPSIAIDPTDPRRIVIGWRQFDTVSSNFRQAGWGYSHDAGQNWTFPGVLEPGVFRSDPVLAASPEGVFYYYSLTSDFTYDLYTSFDGGVTWPRSIPAAGGDKGWMIVDKTGGRGHGNIYAQWTFQGFGRSTDGGETFGGLTTGSMIHGTLAVGIDGEVYSVSRYGDVSVSLNAWDATQTAVFQTLGNIHPLGEAASIDGSNPNPGGLLNQGWIAVDHSESTTRGNVYFVGIGESSEGGSNIVFSRSLDGGHTWSDPIRVHDDSADSDAWQWFGTMSVAPNGRIDVIWNDSRTSGHSHLCELFYASSTNGGHTWSNNIPISPVFDSYLGWPNQRKIGDYYHMVSDNLGADVAYAATFNGEQDVYYLRIGPPSNDCNENGFPDRDDVSKGRSPDCDGDLLPDECERNFDGDEFIDDCDPDQDNDGVLNELDVCQRTGTNVPVTSDGRPLGDTTHTCDLGLRDYWRFLNCMTAGEAGLPSPREACWIAFDSDEDGDLSIRDFAIFQNGFEASSR